MEAKSGASPFGNVHPGTATDDLARLSPICVFGTVVIAQSPFSDIAVHVVKSPGIGLEGIDGR